MPHLDYSDLIQLDLNLKELLRKIIVQYFIDAYNQSLLYQWMGILLSSLRPTGSARTSVDN